jgi:hypothetical protein
MTLVDQITNAISGRHPIVYLHTPEERRVLNVLSKLLPKLADSATLHSWTCTDGLDGVPGSENPVAAIKHVIASGEPGFFVFKDLSQFMADRVVMRALRDAYQALHARPKSVIVIVSPESAVPDLLEKEIFIIEVHGPSVDELREAISEVQADYPGQTLPEGVIGDIVLALKGLTLAEAEHVMHRVFNGGKADSERGIFGEIFAEKEMLVKKSGFLEFMPPTYDISHIGGMENLRDWILKRKAIFNQNSVDAGLPIPKGILLMGVSGCGKSLTAKVVSSLWNLPLFRLDMNVIYSGAFGNAEATFHKALRTIESVAPAVLWIDEIENGLGSRDDGGFDQSHIFSAFLTWMQEKPPLIFVAATANRIEMLPAEILRKGRFDQVFFCDLPDAADREHIIRIHLKDNEANPDDYDIDYLVTATDGWNGAEIEQAIKSARIDSHQENRAFTVRDIGRHIRSMVPLSETMAEQIKALRHWSYGRATNASKTKKRGV